MAGAAGAAAASSDVAEALKRAAEPGDAPSRGNPKAPVTIVMYAEFQCPFCSRVIPTLGELQALYPEDVRFVWRNLPLPFHEAAGLAAEAGMAAAEQGKFWPMYDRLFANQDRLDPPALLEHAKAVGLDVGKFKAALDSGKFRQRVEADLQLAKDARISGTPTFLINGELLTGAQPLPAFKQRVEEALAKVKGLPPPPPLAAPTPPPGKPAVKGPIMSPFWPPPKVTLPDALLGQRLGAPITIADAPLRGSPKAPVEILYFTALTCGPCGQAAQVLDGLVQTYGPYLRIYAKVLPKATEAEPVVAQVALAAHAAGKFWPFHDAITHGSKWGQSDDQKIEEAAAAVGLNVDELRAAAGRYRAQALEPREALRSTRVVETAFVVNGRLAEGNVALLQLIEAAIKKAGKKPPPWPTPAGSKEPNGLYGQKGPPGGPIFQPMPFLHVSPPQLFAVEPRDDAWASAVEKQLGPLIDKDLRAVEPRLAQSKLECRTTMCRLSWQPGKGDAKAVAGTVGFIYGQPNSRSDGNERFFMLRSNGPLQDATQAADTTVAGVKSRRSTVLYKVRTGRAPAPAGVPAERLPKE